MTDAAGTPPSRRRWLIVVVAVSVALNMFFIGVMAGHMHGRHPHPPPPPPGQFGQQRERFDRIIVDLGLNDAQKAAFQQFQTVMRQHGTAMRTAIAAAWAKIADPATTPDQIPALLDGMVKNRTDFQQDLTGAMGKFLATLTPKQRAEFIEEARDPGHRRPPH